MCEKLHGRKTVLRGSVIMMMFLIIGLAFLSPSTVSAKAKRFDVTLKPSLTSVKVSWPAKKGAVRYKVYRSEVTFTEDDPIYPKLQDYKKVAALKGKTKTSWTDKKVKKFTYYAYVVKAFNQKGKQIACTYQTDDLSYACRGLGRPSLSNGGYGETYTNSRKKLHLYLSEDYYAASTKNAVAVIYRKAEGEKKYKKIATVRMKNGFVEYMDKKVKTGVTYHYKARLIKKSGGKTYRSKKTNTVELPAVNFRAKYGVKCLTPGGTYNGDTLEITLCISKAGKYDGKTLISPVDREWNLYHYIPVKNTEGYQYPFRFTAYSSNNSLWKPIPEKGIELPAKGNLYLKAELQKGENDVIRFGGCSKGKESYIELEEPALTYQGPGVGYTMTVLDLSEETGSAYQEWD